MNECPHCKGISGYFYSFTERVKLSGSWGDRSSESAQDFEILKTNKYAVCIDCEKRVALEDAQKPKL